MTTAFSFKNAPIERAAMKPGMFANDDAIRARAATAPPHIKAGIDRVRESRGLKPLWGPAAYVDHAPGTTAVMLNSSPANLAAVRTASPTALPAKRSKPPVPPDAYFLAGAACPGTTPLPVAFTRDKGLVRERMRAEAFRESLRLIDAGRKVVELRDGHEGPVIATTADGTLSFEINPLVGLVMKACGRVPTDVLADTLDRRAGLSVRFRAERYTYEKDHRGCTVRVIHEADLEHIALIRPADGQPAYRTRVVAVAAAARNAESMATHRAVEAAGEIMLRELAAG